MSSRQLTTTSSIQAMADSIPRKVFFKIIVPNYNNMAYIKQCLDSILEQTF